MKLVAWMNPEGGFISDAKKSLHIASGDEKGVAAWHNTPLYAGEPQGDPVKPKIPSWMQAALAKATEGEG